MELLDVLIPQWLMEHFDSGNGIKVEVLPKVDFSVSARSQLTDEAIIANLLIYAITHVQNPFTMYSALILIR